MSLSRVAVCCAVSLALCVNSLLAQKPNPDFEKVAQKLDKGGTFYMYANLEGVLERSVDGVQPILEQTSDGAAVTGVIRAAIKGLGLSGMNDVGMSVLPIDDKMSQAKFYLAFKGQPSGLFKLRGTTPRKLEGLTLIPADAVFAQVLDMQFDQVIPVIRGLVESVAGGAGQGQVDKGLQQMKAKGVDAEAIFASLDKEIGAYLSLDADSMVDVAGVKVPKPHMAIFLKTKDAKFYDTLLDMFRKSEKETREEKLGEYAAQVVKVGENPYGFAPTIVQAKNWLIFATDPAEAKRAIDTMGGAANVTSSEEFKKLYGDLPADVNGVLYVSPRWGKEVAALAEQIQKTNAAGWKLILDQVAKASAGSVGRVSVSISEPEGIYWITRGSVGAADTLQAAVAAPVIAPILAAIAVPNFLEAGVRSKVSRVRSDMRSMATGIESYYVDWNQYPECTTDPAKMLRRPKEGEPVVSSFANPALTTPIAYLTQFFPDAFSVAPGATFGYYQDKNGWMLFSPGPDKKFDLGWEVYDSKVAQPTKDLLMYFYDPTNGTVSGGDIVRVKQ